MMSDPVADNNAAPTRTSIRCLSSSAFGSAAAGVFDRIFGGANVQLRELISFSAAYSVIDFPDPWTACRINAVGT